MQDEHISHYLSPSLESTLIFDRRRPDGQIADQRGGSRYDITLVSAGPEPRRVARTIAEFTGRTRLEAMAVIETAPNLILQGAGYATAEGTRMALARLGAPVEVRAHEVETADRPARTSTSPASRPTAWEIVGLVFLILVVLAVVASLTVANLGEPTF